MACNTDSGRSAGDSASNPARKGNSHPGRPAPSAVSEREPDGLIHGLYGKYYGLRRLRDDSEVEGWYFVIRERDRAGWVALLAYADACGDPELAADLRQHVLDERRSERD